MIIISGTDGDANNEFGHMLCRKTSGTVSPLHARELHRHLPIVCLAAVHRRITYIVRLFTLSVGSEGGSGLYHSRMQKCLVSKVK
jgi:hypothetical protein